MFKTFVLLTLTSVLVAHADSTNNSASAKVSWPYYAGDAASTKFSPANLINPSNVKNLRVVWDWRSIDESILKTTGLTTLYNETTPLMLDGRLYLNTQLNQVVALDAVTGKKIWSFDPSVYQMGYPAGLGFVQRGVAYWSSSR